MSAASEGSLAGGRGRPALRFAATLAVFALIGPIVGGLVVMIGFTVFGLGIHDPAGVFWVMMAMIVYGLWASYPFGIIPALSVGALVALKDIHGGTSLGLACLFGAVAGAVWSQLAEGSGTNTFLVPTLIAAGVVGTAVCWRLTRGRRRAAEAAS